MSKLQRGLWVLLALMLALPHGAWAELGHTESTGPAVYHPGDILRVRAATAPGQLVTFDLVGVAHGVLMREVGPGVYQGELLLLPSLCRGKTTLLVRNEESGEILRARTLSMVYDSKIAIQHESDGDSLRFAFDDTISAATVRVEAEGKVYGLQRGVTQSSNFFEVELPHATQAEIEAQTINGEWLRQKVKIEQ